MSEVEIQCPECGGKLGTPRNWKEIRLLSKFMAGMTCHKCKKYYTEAEIRERCGL